MAPRLELFPFRFRDPRTGKWVRVRYVAERHEIAARYAEWKITGPAETRDVDPDGHYFAPHLREGASGVGNLGPVLTIAGWKPTRHVPVAGVAM